jgi:hypothetical protein
MGDATEQRKTSTVDFASDPLFEFALKLGPEPGNLDAADIIQPGYFSDQRNAPVQATHARKAVADELFLCAYPGFIFRHFSHLYISVCAGSILAKIRMR